MLNTLKQYFGFDSFRQGQEEVVSSIIAGRSAAAIFPTGSGKSLCYQVPALHLPHLTLVVSPLLALMQDQVRFLHSKNINAASIDSSVPAHEVQNILQGVRSGEIKILMIAVERLKNERFRRFISDIPISLLVVDEAHCISEWGHNFRPDYLKLPTYQKSFNIKQTLLLTATATPKVIEDMAKKFDILPEDIQVTGFYRPNLNLLVEGISEKNKLAYLQNWLFHKARFKPVFRNQVRDKKDKDNHIAPTIVYVTLQQTAELVARSLEQAGFHATAYHAGLDSEQRRLIQTDFMAGYSEIIVATIAFGMGIDKSNIRNVIHYDLPKSIENYSQEIGRAGRDGQPSDCLVLANRQELQVLENFVYGDTPELEGITQVLNDIKQNQEVQSYDVTWSCQSYTLSNDSNIRQLPLKTLLVYLEMLGLIEPKYSYFAEYKFKLLVDENELAHKFEGERQAFVKRIFEHSQKAKTWWTLDIQKVIDGYQRVGGVSDRQRILSAMEYFSEHDWLELQAKQLTDVYRVLAPEFEVSAAAQKLYSLFADKQSAEINRIHNMLDMFEKDVCLSWQLADYFGDQTVPNPCGHCSFCAGHKVELPLADSVIEQAIPDVKGLLQSFIESYVSLKNAKPSRVLMTRFLCGITTPVFTKLRARKIANFGKFQSNSYLQVFNWINESDLH